LKWLFDLGIEWLAPESVNMKTCIARQVKMLAFTLAMGMPWWAQAGDCGQGSRCVVVMGNSITHHGAAASIGWRGDWGMAASEPGKDYVAQLLRMLTDGSKGASWGAYKEGAGGLEGSPDTYKAPEDLVRRARGADLVVLEMGDNVNAKAAELQAFGRAYAATALALKPVKGKLACVSTWWSNADKDKVIRQACGQAGGVFVDISALSAVPGNVARNEQVIAHEGVGSHPGDAGMKAIAQKVYAAVSR
jgi:hypothetical protein